jgi:hypothetical protein
MPWRWNRSGGAALPLWGTDLHPVKPADPGELVRLFRKFGTIVAWHRSRAGRPGIALTRKGRQEPTEGWRLERDRRGNEGCERGKRFIRRSSAAPRPQGQGRGVIRLGPPSFPLAGGRQRRRPGRGDVTTAHFRFSASGARSPIYSGGPPRITGIGTSPLSGRWKRASHPTGRGGGWQGSPGVWRASSRGRCPATACLCPPLPRRTPPSR